MPLPARTADTMSEAIALSSPSGRMSKRAMKAAQHRISAALFGPEGLSAPCGPAQPTEAENLRAHAAQLRQLASAGMSTKKYTRLAAEAEARASALFSVPPGGTSNEEERN